MHQGVADEFLYSLDLNWRDPVTHWPDQIFFTVLDSLGSCAAMKDDYAMTGYIELFDPVRLGEGRHSCEKPGADEYKPVIATKPLTFRFVFDGSNVHPAPENPGSNGAEPIVPVTSYFVPEAGHPVKLRR
jgi:hypothetical protein